MIEKELAGSLLMPEPQEVWALNKGVPRLVYMLNGAKALKAKLGFYRSNIFFSSSNLRQFANRTFMSCPLRDSRGAPSHCFLMKGECLIDVFHAHLVGSDAIPTYKVIEELEEFIEAGEKYLKETSKENR